MSRFLNLGSALVVLALAALFGAWIHGRVVCSRFESAAARAADSVLDIRSDVAAIVSTRAAVRSTATDAGLRGAKVKAYMRRGDEEHVLVIHVHSRSCEARYERPLGRLLTAEELDVLDRADVWEKLDDEPGAERRR